MGCFQPGWALSLIDIPLTEFNQSIIIKRFPGGASNDMIPNPQNPENPLPYDPVKVSKTIGAGGR
jgi:arylsulfatase